MEQKPENTLDVKTLENWLWEAACKIRGDVDAPKYKDYILPLIFLKRLSDVFEDELTTLTEDYGKRETAEKLLKDDHSLVRFYIPPHSRWDEIKKQTTGLGELLTDAARSIARENPKLLGVIDIVDFNATTAGQRVISDDKLRSLIDVLGRHRLGLKDVDPDIVGRAYEYLLRKFAEGSGSSAGEFYTPGEVAHLMGYILNPEPGEEIYDPCCGSGGLLIKAHTRFREKYGDDPKKKPITFFGQEILHSTFAMAKMNAFIHDMEAEIALGDTMSKPAFLEKDGSLEEFDVVTANPMWNQDFTQATYEQDPHGRFALGYPPNSSADWGWIQHMFASLNDRGRMAVVLDTGAVSRGSGNAGKNKERDIRKEFVDRDLVEAVILLPDNLFYNTTAPGIILIANKAKKHKNEILLINASGVFQKGRPKNFIPEERIPELANLYLKWKESEGVSKIISKEDAIKADYNISPSRFISQNGKDDTLPLEDAVIQLKAAEEDRAEASRKLKEVLKSIGVEL